MAYASIDDMVQRFGEAEMIRASTPDGAEAVAIVPPKICAALDDASAIIDTYLRKRYRVPLDVAPAEITRACCIIARYDISTGGQRQAAEQVEKDRDAIMSWLGKIAAGSVVLDLKEVAPGDESYATTQSRTPMLSDGQFGPGNGGYQGCGGFWGDGCG
jgi:phage gp36-like protein